MAEQSEFSRPMSDPLNVKATTPSQAIIGPSLVIKGDLIGQENVLVQGRVEGSINLTNHSLTVGDEGVVKADVQAKNITVEGKVQGDLRGEEIITIRQTGDFRGTVIAPRVSLEDGCKFKGSVDMDVTSSARAEEPAATPSPKRKS